MKKLEIQLTESVNGVAFGTDRTVVRHAFGNDYAEFKKSSSSKNTTDDYGCFQLFYSAENALEAIEICTDTLVIVNGKELTLKCPEIIEWIQSVDPAAEKESDGIISKKMSIGLYAPCNEFETLLFGKKDYYC